MTRTYHDHLPGCGSRMELPCLLTARHTLLCRSSAFRWLLLSLIPILCGQPPRLASPVDTSRKIALAGELHPAARAGVDRGVLPAGQTLNPILIGGVPANIRFAGVTQINFTIDPATPIGDQPVVVKVGTAESAAVVLTVTQ